MKNWTKMLALMLAAVLALGCLAGCSSTKTDTENSGNTDTAANTDAAETTDTTDAVSGTDWPTKTVEIVVPGGAGGDTDLCTRMLATKLQEALGQNIVVTNVGGSGGSVGARQVLEAEPDGYTLLMFHPGMLLTQLSGVADFGFKDFDMVANCYIDNALVWVANAKAEFSSMTELIDYAKDHTVSYATDFGGHTHAVCLMVEKETGVEFNIVDAGGSSDRVAALMGNQIDLMATSYGMVKDYVESGDFKILGVADEERNMFCPDVPTFIEQGINVTAPKNYFLSFPKGVDPAIIEKLSSAIETILSDPDFQSEVQETLSVETLYMSPEALYDYNDALYRQYEALFQEQ